MKKALIVWCCCCLIGLAVPVVAQPALIPCPQQYTSNGQGMFLFSEKTGIVYQNNAFQVPVAVFQELLRKWKSFSVLPNPVNAKAQKNRIVVTESRMDSGAYVLIITASGIHIETASVEGLGNAFSTLLQMLLMNKDNRLVACRIADGPKYRWRGFMLDESRHFFGKDEVKKLLDQMYLFKLNRFHWHLTDEPAWRLQIRKYPLLTTKGAKGNYTDSSAAPVYYTQADIREIVAYAAARNIIVIPEIDMPGHATAANKAYPEYTGGGSEKHPDFTFNPGKEKVYTYLTDILKETGALFPSAMIHLGGDEVSFGNEKWETDPSIQQLKKLHNLSDNLAVEHYFLRRMADSVRSMGAKVLGWDEVVDEGLPPDSTIVLWWRHDKPEQLQKALRAGYQVVICPRIPFYFDFVQDQRDKVGRRWGGAFASSRDAFTFSPDSLVAPKYRSQVLGLQANLWTETVKSPERLEYLVFPRLVAMASAAWNPQPEPYDLFEEKVKMFYPFWQSVGLHFFDLLRPDNTPEITDKTMNVQYLDNANK